MNAKKMVMIGFDSVSLGTLDLFVKRGVMPATKKLMEEGSVTQTWPCFPMETGTNWACLATGASPAVTGCNMHLRVPGTNPDQQVSCFPDHFCKAEQIWTTAQRAGKKPVVFDWTQSYPLKNEEGIIHLGEDGRPDSAIRALQEAKAYATHPREGVKEFISKAHVRKINPEPAYGWKNAPKHSMEFEVVIEPGLKSRYKEVSSLFALILQGENGYDRVALYQSKDEEKPLLACELNKWTPWVLHDFSADGKKVKAALRAKLLVLSSDGGKVQLYLSEIYCQEDFAHPRELAAELLEKCGPYIIQCSRQQVVTGGVSDIATYFEEQFYLADWYAAAAEYILQNKAWDMFMLKWHGPDWTNHLTMYMIDPRHPMYEQERAEEGWKLWDELMARGDAIISKVVEAAGPDALVALVSDHGGDTDLPCAIHSPGINSLLERQGWLHYTENGKIDWSRTVAYSNETYVYINLKGRDPEGIVAPGEEYARLRMDIMRALLKMADGKGRPVFQAVFPVETAGRLGVGGDVAGDVFMIKLGIPPEEAMTKEEFLSAYAVERSGTWDWPKLNTGTHTDDSYFVLCGPGIKKGYRRSRPTLITSVAPTLATAWGIPVPKDADGSVLWDFMEE